MSVLTRATPLTGRPRSLAMEATSLVLSRMIDDAPRCCKKAARIAVNCAVDYLKDKLEMTLERGSSSKCQYSWRNKECIKTSCPYYSPLKA